MNADATQLSRQKSIRISHFWRLGVCGLRFWGVFGVARPTGVIGVELESDQGRSYKRRKEPNS